MDVLRLVVIDDHPVFSEALVARLNIESDIRVVATASSAQEAQAVIDRYRPDVALIDVDLGTEIDGIEVAARVRRDHPDVRVLMVTCSTDPHRATAAIRAGAVAWVTKDVPAEDLLRAVRGAIRGESYIPPFVLTDVLADLLGAREHNDELSEQLKGLTQRERQVLDLMVDGLDRSEIAKQLFLSGNTVRTHTQKLLAKLRVHTSLEAVSLGLRARAQSGGVRPRAGQLTSIPAR